MNTNMSSRLFMIKLAEKMDKKPSDVESLIEKFEENWINDVEAMKQVTDE